MAWWPSGQAEVCKTSYTGSIPVRASIFFVLFPAGGTPPCVPQEMDGLSGACG